MKRISVTTLGCKVNQCDALMLTSAFDPRRVAFVGKGEAADLYVVNSCTVTHSSGSQSLKTVRQIARQHPGRPIIFTGCHATLDEARERLGDQVVAVVANEAKERLPAMIAELLQQPEIVLGDAEEARFTALSSRPPVKVQDGCDASCAYCIVPRVRGRSRSLPLPDILDQVQAHADAGFGEVVLTGVHLGDYGFDLQPPRDLAWLVERILVGTSVGRVRISSVDPLEISEGLLDLVAHEPRVCRHLHMPLQSGSSRILKSMQRPYDADQARQVFDRVERACADIVVGVDLIAGFPGESDEDHRQSCKLVRSASIAYAHVFPFSPRPGTRAATLPAQVTQRRVHDRCAELRAIAEDKRRARYLAQRGRRLQMAVERADERPGWMRGTSDNYFEILCRVDARPGALVEVQVVDGQRPLRARVVETAATEPRRTN